MAEPQIQRQRALSEADLTRMLTPMVRTVMPKADQYKLASLIRTQEASVGQIPAMGEVAYSGTSRITGASSSFNSFNRQGFYESSNIPLNVLDSMRRDSQMALGMGIVKYPVTTLGFTIDCENPIQKEFLRMNMENSWYNIISSFLLSFDYGFTAFEKVWEQVVIDIDPGKNQRKVTNKSMIMLKKLKALNPSTISVTLDQYNNFMGLKQQSLGRKETILDRQKGMIFTYQEEFGNLFGKSRMTGAYEPWYWKIIANQFFLRWLERNSIPPYVVKYPLGQTMTASGMQANNELAMAMAQAISAYGNLVLPSKMDDSGNPLWAIDTIAQSTTQITLKDVIEDVYNVAILRGLLIPDKKALSGMSDKDTSKFFLSTLEDFVKGAEQKINEEIIKPLIYWNFPKNEAVKARLNIDDIDFEKREEMRKLLSKMMDMSATYIKNLGGLPFDKMPDISKIYETLGIPQTEAANYQLRVYDKNGKEVETPVEPIKEPGPDKGEVTSGNQSKEGRDGTPRDEDKADESAQE